MRYEDGRGCSVVFLFYKNSTGKRLNIQNYIIVCKFDIMRSEIDGTDFKKGNSCCHKSTISEFLYYFFLLLP